MYKKFINTVVFVVIFFLDFILYPQHSLFYRRLGWGHETLRLRGPWALALRVVEG